MGLVALPLIATALALVVGAAEGVRVPPRAGAAELAWWAAGVLVVALTIGAGLGLTFVRPADGAAPTWLFVGVSMLVAAARGFAGCEVLAIPRVLAGRGDDVACVLHSPVDLWGRPDRELLR